MMPLIYARHFAALGAGLLLLGAAGCQKEPESTASQTEGLCKPNAAEALAGKDRISDEDAKQMTGATIVRQLKPGDPATMDFRQERVTIETDPATGKIVRATCG
ncbi:I78 family peptidase inhibitor [Ensifer adhaerens]|uniref:I78 family peptidase inhibitor n=1 Tax=Ensifer adhaerens TaxID=106592 RepID=UPI001EED4057|nr:I78 family peptidase inhibitor [Ensifer adhaerens]